VNTPQILNRPLNRRWLDATLRAARVSSDPIVQEALVDDVLVEANLGVVASKKTSRVLRYIWLKPPPAARPMIEWAIAIEEPVDTRIFHLGAMLAVYPFIGDVYSSIGALLRHSDTVRNADVQRRVVEKWGDRESIHKATVMALNTLKSMEILESGRLSTTHRISTHVEVPPVLQPWVVHALLLTRGAESVDVSSTTSAHELFCFANLQRRIDKRYPFLELHNEGGGRSVLVEQARHGLS
jgi:hypothetical protein